MTNDELIAALEKATGPDRELDFWIWWHAMAWHEIGALPDDDYVQSNLKYNYGPRLTGSLDAALMLVPEGWDWECTKFSDNSYRATVSLVGKGFHAAPEKTFDSCTALGFESCSPAIALCIAALKARGDR